MTKNEERARKLWAEICDMLDSDAIERSILAYADEIRAEAADRVQKLRTACITDCPTYYESGFRDGCNNAIAVITGKEPTK